MSFYKSYNAFTHFESHGSEYDDGAYSFVLEEVNQHAHYGSYYEDDIQDVAKQEELASLLWSSVMSFRHTESAFFRRAVVCIAVYIVHKCLSVICLL